MKTIILALLLTLVPLQAHAGLFEFAVAVAAVVALGPASFGFGVISTWGGVALNVGLMAYGQYKSEELRRQGEEAARRARDAYNASLQDRTITNVSSEAPFITIYGKARVGAAVVAILPSGDRDQYQNIVAIHAAHQCDGIEEIYINKKPLGALDANGFAVNSPDYSQIVSTNEDNTGITWTINSNYVPGSIAVFKFVPVYHDGGGIEYQLEPDAFTQVGNTITVAESGTYRTSYRYKVSTVRVKTHLGAPGEVADATLIAECPTQWTIAHKLSEFCYTYVRIDLTQQEFQGGLVNIEVLARGKHLLDPRLSPPSAVYTDNAALALYDYLRSDACGVQASDIPSASVVEAADVCDQITAIGARYTCNGTVASDQGQNKVITQLAQAMAGGVDSTTWEMWAGDYVAPTLALVQTDIVGPVSITPGLSDADIANGVTGRFIGPENDYVPTDMPPYQNAVYLASDGRELFVGLEFPYTDKIARCHNLARIYVEDQRNGFTVKASFSLKAWDTRIGQRVTLTAPFFGLSAKVFRVVGKSYSPAATVDLLLKEDAASIWDLADAVVVDSTPNTNLPNPFLLDAPTSVTLSSGTAALLKQIDGTIVSRIKVVWPDSGTIYADEVEIQHKLLTAPVWQSNPNVFASTGEAYLNDVRDESTYDVRIRYINPYLQTKSLWLYATPHTVVGKTEPPSNVGVISYAIEDVGIRLSWAEIADADRAGYEIRVGGTSWETATFVDIAPTAAYLWGAQPTGTYTLRIKALDTTGNPSVTASNVSVVISTPGVPSAAVTVVGTRLLLTWATVSSDVPIAAYEVRTADTGWGAAGALYRGNTTETPVAPPVAGATDTWYVRAFDVYGNYSLTSGSAGYTTAQVDTVSGLSVAIAGDRLRLSWAVSAPAFGLLRYEIRTADSGWGGTGALYAADGSFVLTDAPAQGTSQTYYARAVDLLGNISQTSASVSYSTVAVPNVTSVSSVFADTSLTNATVTLTWTDVAPTFGLGGYIISYDAIERTVKANNITLPADWIGVRTFTVKTVDSLGRQSTGTSAAVTKLVPNPVANFHTQVIDNKLLLFWDMPAKTSLPIQHVILKKGDVYATAEVIGTKDGSFTLYEELVEGTYKYWAVVVDTDGYESSEVSVTSTVGEPPDFVFQNSFDSVFGGTLTNALLENAGVVMPVNLTETFAQHFTSRGWAGPSAQVAAGYPIYIQPTPSSASYQETFDLGTILGSSQVLLTYGGTTVAGDGTFTLTPTIELSPDNATWTTYAGQSQVFGISFRYIRITVALAVGSGDTAVYRLENLNVLVTAKLKNDAGRIDALSTDASGTVANFGKDFIDITGLSVTAKGTTSISAVYDFNDQIVSGTYSVTSNVVTVNATAHGLVAGQNVKLMIASGTAASQTVTVATTPTADQFTATMVTGNTSGNLSIYSQGIRIYLFNSTTGARVSGEASWTAKGY